MERKTPTIIDFEKYLLSYEIPELYHELFERIESIETKIIIYSTPRRQYVKSIFSMYFDAMLSDEIIGYRYAPIESPAREPRINFISFDEFHEIQNDYTCDFSTGKFDWDSSYWRQREKFWIDTFAMQNNTFPSKKRQKPTLYTGDYERWIFKNNSIVKQKIADRDYL